MARQFSLTSRIKLNNGLLMPRIHLGVYMMSRLEAEKAVNWALEAGYRGIDTAEMYHNERSCGQAVARFLKMHKEVSRNDLWHTTKLASNSSYEAACKAIDQSLGKSGLDYVDLYLIHSPYGGKKARLESWRAIEDAIDAGQIKCGGVSNYGVKHLQELLDSKPRHLPVVNQIEVHPFNTREEICQFCTKHDIVVEAYAPLVHGQRMDHKTITSLAQKYDCSPGQLLVRWSLQRGYVPLPKSVKKSRIVENSGIDAFDIESADMETMNSLDEYLVTDWDPVDAP